MLTPEVYRGRADRLRRLMRERGLDAVVVYSAPLTAGWASSTNGNTLYLADWQNLGLPTVLVLVADGEAAIFGTSLPYGQHWPEKKGLWVERRYDRVEPASIRRLLDELVADGARIGLIGRAEMPTPFYAIVVAGNRRIVAEDCDDLLVVVKRARDEGEIELGRRAVANAEAMLAAVVDGVRAGKRVVEVAADARHAALCAGSDWADVWIGSGPDADELATIAWQGDRHIEDGELVHAVVFNTYRGRHAQLIRTGVKGGPSPAHERHVNSCVEAQERTLEHLQPGRRLIDAATAVQQAITELTPGRPGCEARAPARCGHVQGVQYTEPGDSDPFVAFQLADKAAAERVLVRDGMRMVIHPSIVVPGLGWFSVGDNILVGPDGPELLGDFPRTCFDA